MNLEKHMHFARLPWKRTISISTALSLMFPLSAWALTRTTVDSSGITGLMPSVTMDTDGLALISYDDASNGDLRMAHCADNTCSVVTRNTVDAGGSVGTYSSIALGNDSLPIISYNDQTNADLKVAHCSDIDCSSATITTLASTGSVGSYTSLKIGQDNLAVISYYDSTNGDLKVAHCSNTACTIVTLNTVDSTGDVGQYTSLAIGNDGLPIITYYDQTNTDLKVAHCSDVACSSSTITTIDSVGNVGRDTSIAIGQDDLAIISYWDLTNSDLKTAHCSNTSCTSVTLTTVDSVGSVGRYTSIVVGSNGIPVISYQNTSNGNLKTAECQDAECSRATVSTIDTSDTEMYMSNSIDGDGYVVIAFLANGSADLIYTLTDIGTDILPPSHVTATPSGSAVTLQWDDPSAYPSYATTIIRRSTTGYPSTPTSGTAVTSGVSGSSYTDSGLSDGYYFYTVFHRNTLGVYSGGRNAVAWVDNSGTSDVCTPYVHLDFESTGTPVATDDSGNGFNASVYSGSIVVSNDYPTTGFTNAHSFLFERDEEDAIQITRPVQDDFTLCAWFKTTAVGAGTSHWQTMGLFDAEYPFSANDYGLGVDSNGKLTFGAVGDTFNGTTDVHTGDWTHACVTRRKVNGAITLYVNGNYEKSGTGSTNSLTAASSMIIGYGHDGGNYWDGNIDDVRIYDSVLSASDIASLGHASLSCSAASSSSSSSSSERAQNTGGGRRGSPGRGGSAPLITGTITSTHTSAPVITDTPIVAPTFKARTCDRVMKWFKNDTKMIGRVNERLEKRFGFICR